MQDSEKLLFQSIRRPWIYNFTYATVWKYSTNFDRPHNAATHYTSNMAPQKNGITVTQCRCCI